MTIPISHSQMRTMVLSTFTPKVAQVSRWIYQTTGHFSPISTRLDRPSSLSWSLAFNTFTTTWSVSVSGLSSFGVSPEARTLVYGAFHKRRYPNSWMVYFRENSIKVDEWFRSTSISGNPHITRNYTDMVGITRQTHQTVPTTDPTMT